ncbi:hypothetical protein FH972_019568 [Carpinus fangiana]|uniref:Uncharacterized protein n=1 Tax=Carpinus fangiana TaxID=176857 RepID=A0A5N6RQI1_9ROSI|nr:hypothetical protein FH972_019568 [Carpinus fangiana]
MHNPYINISPVPTSSDSSSGKRPMEKVIDALSRCGKKAEVVTRKAEAMADNVWHHLRTSPSVTDAAMARLAQGTKIIVQLDQLGAVNPSTNRSNPSEKYIQIVTRDGHQLWFMGFVSYDKALKNLTEALRRF